MSREDKKFFHNTEKELISNKISEQIKVVIFGKRLSLLTFMEGDSAEVQGLFFNVTDSKVFSNGKELTLKKRVAFLLVTFLLQIKILLFQKKKKQISLFTRKLMFCFPMVKFISIPMAVSSI